MESDLRILLCGPLTIERRDDAGAWQPVASWAQARKTTRQVLRRLLTLPGRRASRGQIQEDLWPDLDQELADHQLDNAISAIRSAIGRDLLARIETTYQLAGQAQLWVDLDAAAELVREAENTRVAGGLATEALEQAVALLARGPVLEGEDGAWRHGIQKHAEDMLRQARLWLAEAYDRQGKLWQASEHYRVLCSVLDEEALRAWMKMLALHDRPQEALQRYQDAQAEHGELTALTDQLASQIETYLEPPRFQMPELPRILASDQFVTAPAAFAQTLYDELEVTILTMALRWERSSSLLHLQQITADLLRKEDHHHPEQQATRISRRHALQAIAAFPIQLYGLKHVGGATTMPSSDVLPLCAAGLVACRELRQYEQAGMQEIARILSVYLPTLEKLALHASPQQRQAAHLAGQSYLLIGILADHYGKLDHMEAASKTARRYGQLAQDVSLEASALARLAVKYDYERDDARALHTYQEAAALPGFHRASPLIQGRIYAGLAGAHAYCLQEQESLTALGMAQEIWPASPEKDPAFHFAYTSENTLALWSGLARKHTGHYDQAAEAFLEYGAMQPTPGLFETNRADFLNYVASVGVRQRDLDMATLYVEAAATIAWDIHHAQRQAEIRDTVRSMQLLWPRKKRVSHLLERTQHANGDHTKKARFMRGCDASLLCVATSPQAGFRMTDYHYGVQFFQTCTQEPAYSTSTSKGKAPDCLDDQTLFLLASSFDN